MNNFGKYLLRVFAAIIALGSATQLLLAIGAIFHKGDPPGFFIPPAVILALLAWGIWYWSGATDRINLAEQKKYSRIAQEAVKFFDSVNSSGSFPPVAASRIVSQPDNPVLAACQASVLEMTTEQVRGYLGARVKVGSLPVYIGQSRGTQKRKLSEVATGELALTPKALVFSGAQRSIDVELKHIVAIDIAIDAITISVKGRQKPYIFIVPNGFLSGMLVRNLIQIDLNGRSLPDGVKLQII